MYHRLLDDDKILAVIQDLLGLDFVFTVCDSAAREQCPLWPGHPVTAHWSVPDPAAVTGDDTVRRTAFLDAFLMLRRHLETFVNDTANGITNSDTTEP